ncbi:hypothetical protein G7Z17_g5526 [Cylindrodendrum hubeiense]|uniref:Uncharacterized protein n=1 Tax=Cylindrodendrum hubeiense TaxID=595255 RepID=A0A9P5HCT8_9HYPO|nr:hypothetical protein G7Z17_g5526 [Cylindrodendrum hubeiense]
MATPAYHNGPTAEMPMSGGDDHHCLIRILESNQSLYELCQELPALADKLEELDRNASGGGVNTSPVARMGRDVIKYIILGTVAYDDRQPSRWYPNPQQGEKEVDAKRKFLRGNVDLTLEEMNRREEQVQMLSDDNRELDRMDAKMLIMERDRADLHSSFTASRILRRLNQSKRELEETLKILREQTKIAKTALAINEMCLK